MRLSGFPGGGMGERGKAAWVHATAAGAAGELGQQVQGHAQGTGFYGEHNPR